MLTDKMLAVETRGLCKNFGEFQANNAIDFKAQRGRIHAVIGENGAGKSTLMKILFGLEQASSGELFIQGKPVNFKNALDAIHSGIGMVQQHFAMVENASVIENIILGAEPARAGVVNLKDAITTMQSLLPSDKLSVPWNTKVEDLSVGFRQRVEILKVIYRRAEIMIFDEPTGVLTPQESDDLYKVLKTLKNAGKTILLVTHKLEDVLKYADDYSVLRRGKLVGTGRVSEIKMQELVELMVGRPVEMPQIQKHLQGPVILEVQNLSTQIRPQLKNINLKIHSGEILGVAGIEGAGQKSLVDALMGLITSTGEIFFRGQSLAGKSTQKIRNLGFANIPEDRLKEGVWSEGTAQKNILPGRESIFFKFGILSKNLVQLKAKEWFEKFDVRVPTLDTPCGRLSGGNQQKLIFCRELAEKNISILLCHQPSRGVDIGAMERIHRQILELRSTGAGILLISSDLDELLALSDRMIVFYEGRVQQEFERNDFDIHKIGKAMAGVSP